MTDTLMSLMARYIAVPKCDEHVEVFDSVEQVTLATHTGPDALKQAGKHLRVLWGLDD